VRPMPQPVRPMPQLSLSLTHTLNPQPSTLAPRRAALDLEEERKEHSSVLTGLLRAAADGEEGMREERAHSLSLSRSLYEERARERDSESARASEMAGQLSQARVEADGLLSKVLSPFSHNWYSRA